jgi:hypothetical protein
MAIAPCVTYEETQRLELNSLKSSAFRHMVSASTLIIGIPVEFPNYEEVDSRCRTAVCFLNGRDCVRPGAAVCSGLPRTKGNALTRAGAFSIGGGLASVVECYR